MIIRRNYRALGQLLDKNYSKEVGERCFTILYTIWLKQICWRPKSFVQETETTKSGRRIFYYELNLLSTEFKSPELRMP